jgi:hypothetical protein
MAPEPPSPEVPAGWYPDPAQTATQRYWDGAAWTDQRAPLVEAPSPAQSVGWTLDVSARLVLGILGAVAAVIGIFLPHAESASLLHIANNTLISSSDGIIVVVLALAGAAAAVRDSSKPSLSWSLVLLGVVLIGVAFFEGGSEQLKVVNGLGQEVEATAGPGVWAVGIGGALMVVAGFARWRRPALDTTDGTEADT